MKGNELEREGKPRREKKSKKVSNQLPTVDGKHPSTYIYKYSTTHHRTRRLFFPFVWAIRTGLSYFTREVDVEIIPAIEREDRRERERDRERGGGQRVVVKHPDSNFIRQFLRTLLC